jgi:hypothetical protein
MRMRLDAQLDFMEELQFPRERQRAIVRNRESAAVAPVRERLEGRCGTKDSPPATPAVRTSIFF